MYLEITVFFHTMKVLPTKSFKVFKKIVLVLELKTEPYRKPKTIYYSLVIEYLVSLFRIESSIECPNH
jgi:hypothetical protein